MQDRTKCKISSEQEVKDQVISNDTSAAKRDSLKSSNQVVPLSDGLGDLLQKQKAVSASTISNDASAAKGVACESPNPIAPVSSNSDNSPTDEKPVFSLGISSAKNKSTNESTRTVKLDPAFAPAKNPDKTSSEVPKVCGFGDFMAKQKAATTNKWTCDICMVSNDIKNKKCLACETPNPKASPSKETKEAPKFKFGVQPSKDEPKPDTISEPVSTPAATMGFGAFMNKSKKSEDSLKSPSQVAPVSGGFGDLLQKQKAASASKWTCDICMISNDASAAKCVACESPNPKAPVSSTSDNPPTDEKPKFSFGISPAENTKSFTFGTTAKTNFGTEPKAEKPAGTMPTFAFGTTAKTDFGADTKAEKPVETTPTFAFGTKAKTDFVSETKVENITGPPKFLFGQKPVETSSFTFSQSTKTASELKTPVFSFGQKQTEEPEPVQVAAKRTRDDTSSAQATTPVQQNFSFGAPVGSTVKPEFSFGSSKPNSIVPEAKPIEPTFSFGGGAAQTTIKPMGTLFNPDVTKKPKAPTSSLGKTSSTESKPSFTFGQSQDEKAKSSIFGNEKRNENSSGLFSFGAGATKPSVEAPKPTFSFGATSPSSNNAPTPSKPSFSFGGPPSNQEPSKPSLSFGQSNNFGQTEQKNSLFGDQGKNNSNNSGFNFGGNSSTFVPSTQTQVPY